RREWQQHQPAPAWPGRGHFHALPGRRSPGASHRRAAPALRPAHSGIRPLGARVLWPPPPPPGPDGGQAQRPHRLPAGAGMTPGVQTVEKFAGAAAAMATLLPSLFTNDLTTPVIGVGLATVGGAALGTFAAIAYDEQVRPRGKLIMLAPATVIIASSAVGVIP